MAHNLVNDDPILTNGIPKCSELKARSDKTKIQLGILKHKIHIIQRKVTNRASTSNTPSLKVGKF